MLLAGPGATNSINNLLFVNGVLIYPVFLFLIYWYFDKTFFSFSPLLCLAISGLLVGSILIGFGFTPLLVNLTRGIANEGYCTTNSAAYFDAKPIANADIKSFKVLDSNSFGGQSEYAVDNQAVYRNGLEVEAANPSVFSVLPNSQGLYWLDDKGVFYEGIRLSGANPLRFRRVSEALEDYWQDDESVYFQGKGLAESSANDFLVYQANGGYTSYAVSRDSQGKHHVYWREDTITGADAETFTVLSDSFAKDSRRVYGWGVTLNGIDDPLSFVLHGDSVGADRLSVYDLGYKVLSKVDGADPASIVVFERRYLKDNATVFYQPPGKAYVPLSADPNSFEVTGYDEASKSEARDNNSYFLNGIRVGER